MLSGSWPETHMAATGCWKPSPGHLIPSSFANIKEDWLVRAGETGGIDRATHRQDLIGFFIHT